MNLVPISAVTDALGKSVGVERTVDVAAQSAIAQGSAQLRILLMHEGFDRVNRADVFRIQESTKFKDDLPKLRLSAGFVVDGSVAIISAIEFESLLSGTGITNFTVDNESGLILFTESLFEDAVIEVRTILSTDQWVKVTYSHGFQNDTPVVHTYAGEPDVTDTFAVQSEVPDWLKTIAVDRAIWIMSTRGSFARGDSIEKSVLEQMTKVDDQIVTAKARMHYDSKYHFSTSIVI